MSIKIVGISLLLLVLVLVPTANAEDLQIKQEQINPGTIYYQFKRGWEKIVDYLEFSDNSKYDYARSLLGVRLAELNFVVDNNILGELETSTQRFSYQAGILTQRTLKLNDSTSKEVVIDQFNKEKELLQKLQKKYEFNSSFWMLMEHSINSLNSYIEALKK